jgi:glycosyltransferase involved in cell wall biosynthesis
MGGAGVLLESSSPAAVCQHLYRLMRNRPYRRRLIDGQRRRAEGFRTPQVRRAVAAALAQLGLQAQAASAAVAAERRREVVRIEGPCEGNYSLALVNRELAKAMDALGQPVELFCTEGPGDYSPDPEAIRRLDPIARRLMTTDATGASAVPAMSIRNMYPPRVRDAKGKLNQGYFFWEESFFPAEFVSDFNLSLDGLLAPSRFVADVWRSSGVNIPIHHVGTGADHVMQIAPEPLPVALPPGFRFLHVSSCFPRKGPDLLLQAWGDAFAGRTDVVLVIKSFPNVHNRVPEMLEEMRRARPDFPPVVLLMDDYTSGQLRSLYEACQAYVAPSRGEGFGLPMAEAMLHGLPVIATGWGGHADFCDETTSFPIRYTLKPSSSHVASPGLSLWAEPDVHHLAELMRQVRAGGDDVEARVARARERITSEYTWQRVAERSMAAAEHVDRLSRDFAANPLRMGWVSTWNETCGIATYTKYLLDHAESADLDVTVYARVGTSSGDDRLPFIPAWRGLDDPLDELTESVLRNGTELLVVQFNFGFFNIPALARMTARLESLGVRVVLMLHSTRDVEKPDIKASLREGVSGLEQASRILVHSEDDLNRLIDYGLGARAAMFPHGVMDVPMPTLSQVRDQLGIDGPARIIASYGFMLPHKGLLELVEAFAALCRERSDVYLFMVNAIYPHDTSSALRRQISDRIDALGIRQNVRVFTDFLSEDVSLTLLGAADLVVFPYQETAESASGAVRFGFAAHRPVACTPLRIFSDFEGLGLRFRGCQAVDIATDLREWLDDDDGDDKLVLAQDEWVRERSWPKLMLRLTDICRGLVIDGIRP